MVARSARGSCLCRAPSAVHCADIRTPTPRSDSSCLQGTGMSPSWQPAPPATCGLLAETGLGWAATAGTAAWPMVRGAAPRDRLAEWQSLHAPPRTGTVLSSPCPRKAHRKRGSVCTNCPSMVGRRGSLEKTGASIVKPFSGLQKPLVSQSVKGQGMPSSRTSAKMLWYCVPHSSVSSQPGLRCRWEGSVAWRSCRVCKLM